VSRTELPDPATSLELERLLGVWYVLFSNRSDWRTRTHPRIEWDLLDPAGQGLRLQSTTRFRGADLLGRAKPRVSVTETVAEPDDPLGCFGVRGTGLLRSTSRMSIPLIDPDYRWLVIWNAGSSLADAAGIDVYTRDPSLPQVQLDRILAQITEHPFLRSRAAGLYATTQHWFPIDPYRLELSSR
jgi:hypothetical protein